MRLRVLVDLLVNNTSYTRAANVCGQHTTYHARGLDGNSRRTFFVYGRRVSLFISRWSCTLLYSQHIKRFDSGSEGANNV